MVLIWYTKHAIPRMEQPAVWGSALQALTFTDPANCFLSHQPPRLQLVLLQQGAQPFLHVAHPRHGHTLEFPGRSSCPNPLFLMVYIYITYLYIYICIFIYILWILKCLIILHPGSIVSHAFHSCLSRGIQRSLDGPRGGLAHSVCCEGKKALRPGHSSHRRGISIGGSSTSSIQVHCCGHPIQLHLWSIRYQCWTSFDNICIYIYECK